MKQVSQSSKIKIIIIIGYLLLILLAVYGLGRIYSELRAFSEYDRPFEERKELVLISSTLASLYESESMSRMLLSSVMENREKKRYDSLMHKVVEQKDSLYKMTSDTLMHRRLDRVSNLLDLKYENTYQMFQLMDSIDLLPFRRKSVTTILSKKDMENLKRISSVMQTHEKQDTTIVQVKKKTFAQRFSDVFKSEVKDSVLVKSQASSSVIDSIIPMEQLLTDTIVEYMTDVFLDYDQKRELYVARLAYKQNFLFQTNVELTDEINKILRELEVREYQKIDEFSGEKKRALKDSYTIASRVAITALLTAIIFIILSLRSLSREQKYRRKLENAKKYAEDLLKSREKLMLTISHDIKTPLSSIIGYIELLTKSKLPAKEKYYLENMQGSSEQVLELVTKLLDYHRLESGKQEANIMHFSPARLLNDIHISIVPLATKKGLELEFVSDLKPEQIYQSDPFRIRQIVNNLLSNAVKFTDTGKITLSVSVFSSRKGDVLNIIVKDTGRGIDPVSQERIFEEFSRVNNVDAEGIEGSGLGLAISRKLALLLKGDIQVKSTFGEGSEFTVHIPLLSNVEDIQQATLKEQEKNKIKILFVDDDLVLLDMYTELLRSEGFNPVRCLNSLEALTMLQDQPFDIVFTDIQMPDMNGFELVERIRVASFPKAKEIPIIALSARSDISESQFIEAGFSGFLAKPFTSTQLLDLIVSLVGNIHHTEKRESAGSGFSTLTAFAGKDKDAARHIIKTFIQENIVAAKTMEDALVSDDWAGIRSHAHKLLPLMRMIDAGEIVKILYNMENNVRESSEVHDLVRMIKQKNKEAELFLKTLN